MSIHMPTMPRNKASEAAANKAVLHAAKRYLDISVSLNDEEKTGLFLAIKYIEQGDAS